jgi:sterol desaturase/sphingolipid hydroxylase (fatty acid hydroxylase superfamily)
MALMPKHAAQARTVNRYVHSLHHRNIDIEPFAGLAMHPIEHMSASLSTSFLATALPLPPPLQLYRPMCTVDTR